MSHSSIANVVLVVLCALIHISYNLQYSELEVLGASCPEEDKCEGYRFNKNYTERNCECDSSCMAYNDCCIDYRRQSQRRPIQVTRNRMVCLNVGDSNYTGVYVLATCSDKWSGPSQVQEMCEGPVDFSDPLMAAPVTSIAQAITYKNRYCAECNNADMTSLKHFQLNISCEGFQGNSGEEIFPDMTYNTLNQTWGVTRLNNKNEATFYSCDIIFDAPPYLKKSMRFCRANLVSSCSSLWTRSSVKRQCAEYMAVVYAGSVAYRNPHCAICNFKSVEEISCKIGDLGRKRPISFGILLDINPGDGDKVGMTRVRTQECPPNNIYDSFFKKCRRLACAMTGYDIVDGKCVKS